MSECTGVTVTLTEDEAKAVRAALSFVRKTTPYDSGLREKDDGSFWTDAELATLTLLFA